MKTKAQPATPLQQLTVKWEEYLERVTLVEVDGTRTGRPLAVAKDSGKGKAFEEIARRANAYPKLVAELHALTTCHPERLSAISLLRELGEIEDEPLDMPSWLSPFQKWK